MDSVNRDLKMVRLKMAEGRRLWPRTPMTIAGQTWRREYLYKLDKYVRNIAMIPEDDSYVGCR